jgi:hypothetical protein
MKISGKDTTKNGRWGDISQYIYIALANAIIYCSKPCYMKNTIFSCTLLLLISLGFHCRKTNSSKTAIVKGTIIGFNPCTGNYTNYAKIGYVIKIETLTDSGVSIVIDTSTIYNLPQVFNFPPTIFANYQYSYKFPINYQNTFKFKFSYIQTPDPQKIYPLCTDDINLGDFPPAIGDRQILITKFYGIIP